MSNHKFEIANQVAKENTKSLRKAAKKSKSKTPSFQWEVQAELAARELKGFTKLLLKETRKTRAKNKTLSPKDAKGEKQVCMLQTDHYETKDFWILIDAWNNEVYIHQQKTGEKSKQDICIPKKDFNRLVEWYLKEQKVS
jgi:hypothetical protein